jgi:hypothetical protein
MFEWLKKIFHKNELSHFDCFLRLLAFGMIYDYVTYLPSTWSAVFSSQSSIQTIFVPIFSWIPVFESKELNLVILIFLLLGPALVFNPRYVRLGATLAALALAAKNMLGYGSGGVSTYNLNLFPLIATAFFISRLTIIKKLQVSLLDYLQECTYFLRLIN